MHTQITGRAYPPRSSSERAATFVLIGDQARLDAEGSTFCTAALNELSFEAPVGRGPRQIVFPDGSLFWTENLAAVEEIERELSIGRLSRFEAYGPRLALWVALAFVGAWAIWRFALPVVIWVAVALTPEPLRDAMDDGAVVALDRVVSEPSQLADAEQARVREVFKDLLRTADKSSDEFTLLFRDMPGLGPNAMALPGGTIIITDELVLAFPDPSVIASVLAHEIGHVESDHGLWQVYRSLGIYVLITMIAGDTGPLLEDALLEGGLLLSLTYSREFESEADRYGLKLASDAGYDPEGLLEFFQSLPDADETDAGWTSTHPASGERIKAIRAWLEER